MNQEAGASAGDPDSYINEYIHIVQHICCSIYSIYKYIAISQLRTAVRPDSGFESRDSRQNGPWRGQQACLHCPVRHRVNRGERCTPALGGLHCVSASYAARPLRVTTAGRGMMITARYGSGTVMNCQCSIARPDRIRDRTAARHGGDLPCSRAATPCLVKAVYSKHSQARRAKCT